MNERKIPEPPAGFVSSEGRGPFGEHNGPWRHRVPDGPGMEHALFILPRHTNGLGVLHGGMLATFFDGLLGAAVVRDTGQTGMTIQLSVDFLRMARRGEWLQGRAEVSHATRDLAFAEGRAFVGGRLVGTASGVFKLMARRRERPARRSRT